MCELLGMSANVPTDICFSFTGLMLRGGKTGPHKDGWGITFYEGRAFAPSRIPSPAPNLPSPDWYRRCPSRAALWSATFGRPTVAACHWKIPTPLPVSCGAVTGPSPTTVS